MKILHISNFYPPFSGSFVGNQCRMIVDELSKRGHFNRVLTSNEVIPAVLDRERAARRRLHVQVHPGSVSFPRVLFNERGNRRVIRDELDEAHPDLAVVWSLSGLSSLPIAELRNRNIPTVFAVADFWPRRREQEDPWYHWWTAPLPLGPRILRRALHATGMTRLLRERYPMWRPTELRFRRAFFVSRALRDSIAHAGFDVQGSEVIPCAIGRDEFPPTAHRRAELRRILWIGKLNTDDDPMTAVQTIQELRHQGGMRFSLDIFGRGSATGEARVHDYLRNSHLGGIVNVRHSGGADLSAIFPNYDLFLHTARYPGAFPAILLRAMAAKLPVVSTVEESSADVIRSGENALAVRAGNPVDCAGKILELAQDPELVARLAKQGYDDVVDNFASVVVAGRVDRFLQGVLQDRSRV